MTSYLVTGGAGSFGQAFVRRVLDDPETSRVVVYSRCEERQRVMEQEVADDRLRFFIGDVRDRERLRLAMRGTDVVVHAAALKQVPACEYNPSEAVATNITGSENVIRAALEMRVKRAVLISSDKATAPVNLYGATKATAEKLFTSGNSYAGADGTRFTVVRYGNVFGSRGSVLHVWRRFAEQGKKIPVTDIRMTRYWFTLDGAVAFVQNVLGRTKGGEVWIPRLPSFRVMDLKKAVCALAGWEETGIRPGEKLHESMVVEDEAPLTWDMGDCFAICPPVGEPLGNRVPDGAVRVADRFRYRSDENTDWLSVAELKALVGESAQVRGAA